MSGMKCMSSFFKTAEGPVKVSLGTDRGRTASLSSPQSATLSRKIFGESGVSLIVPMTFFSKGSHRSLSSGCGVSGRRSPDSPRASSRSRRCRTSNSPTWFCKTKKAQPEHVVAYYKGDGQHRADGSDGDDTALQLALVEEEEEPVVQPEKKKAKRNAKFWTSKDLTGMEVFQDMLEQHTKRNPRLTPDRLRRMTIDAAKTQLPTLFPANMKHDTFKTFPQRICDIKKERAAKAAKEKKDRKAFKTMLQLGDEGKALGAAQRAAKPARRASSPP